MAIENVGGDLFVTATVPLATAANLAGKSLITVAGAAPASAARAVFGVISKDTPSGDYADVKLPGSIVEVLATGTVTKGAQVEALQGTVYANINGTSTSTTSAGVQDLASGYPIGLALTGSSVYGTVLVLLYANQGKTA
jgi:hypothetical protein